ncbi:TPA: hypothetical protein IAC10_14545 [Candidatus Scatousia excrementigallinarum]|uniref:DUF481 domain-containing protein n=1 Tax=Candidatus Scatousia excrementigallinarum TaxID=2840935 RepID=A0A9D1JQ21_9BACT|nr:hypothetical protein [Candidatus Scatousia excrementigallinarum]
MKKALFILMFFMLGVPVFAQEDIKLPNIFIWALPEDNDVSPDDVKSSNPEDEVTLVPETDNVPAKAYAEFIEDAEDTVYLDGEDNNYILNLRVPQKFHSSRLVDSKKIQGVKKYSLYNQEEYSISPQSVQSVARMGNFSLGTMYNSGIDNAQLERSTTLFTRYERKMFAISSAYKKNNLTTRGLTTDNFYLAPELKLNRVFSLSEVLSTDVTRNRRKGELVLSVSPLKDDRMRLEFGAGTTYDIDNDRSWSQVRFNTKFQL